MGDVPVLTTRALTATLWLRQQLLPGSRSVTEVPAMVEHLLGLQAQDNLPPYLSLAARIDGFSPSHLSDLIADRALVRFLTLRGTVHVLTAAQALHLRGWVQPALDRVSASNQQSRPARHLSTAELDDALRPLLTGSPRPLAEIGEHLATCFPDVEAAALKHVVRERLPLLQVPPRGLWKRSGGVVYAFADDYLGASFTEPDIEDLVLRYLAAYGPATAADMTKWSLVTRLGPVFTRLHRDGRLVTHTDEKGRTLFDVPEAPLVEDARIPAVLLGKYDNLFLSHADRDRVAPADALKNWMGVNGGVGSVLFLDGLLAGLWRVEDERVVVEPFTTPTPTQRREIAAEVERVQALLAAPA